VVAYIVGAQVLTTKDPYQILFMIGCAFLTACTIPTLIVAKEERFVPKEVVSRSPVAAFVLIVKGFATMPNVVLRIFIAFFFCWCAYSPFMIYVTTFYGDNVYPSDYNHGVQLGFYGMAINAAVSFSYSMIQTPLLGFIGIRPTFFLAQVIGTACLGALWALSWKGLLTVPIALIVTALLAINFAAFNSIPFALLADAVPSAKIGLYMGVLNSASTLAQVFTNVVAGKLVSAKDENVAWAFCLGAGLSAFASILVWIVKVPTEITEDKTDISEKSPLLTIQ